MMTRKEELINNEAKRIVDSFARNQNIKKRAVTKITRRVLLDAPYLFQGSYFEVKAKPLGAGVYELTLNLSL